MTPPRQTICLCMIVKDEAPVIARCLASVRPIIDHWVIVDTGSTDATQTIVRDTLRDLPGAMHERPWRDFAHNRSEALVLAREHGDYTLIIDADDTLEIPVGYHLPRLDADAYVLDISDGGSTYQRTQIVANALPWRYEGVLHEYLVGDGARDSGHLMLLMRRHHDGARRRDPDTYRRDVTVLERALAETTDPFSIARYTFYLAQSYRDCGEARKAIEIYLRRATLGHWDQKVFVSLYQAAKLMEAAGEAVEEVLATYQRVTEACPSRAEASHGASRLCRYNGLNERGRIIAEPAIDLPMLPNGLFVEPWIYQYGVLDEYAVNAYWTGHNDASLEASLRALACDALPATERERIVANARFASHNLTAWVADADIPAPIRLSHARLSSPAPRVLISILAKQKEPVLPLFLERIEALDYPKSSIVLYVRTNNNTDRTRELLREWVDRVGEHYAGVEFDDTDLAIKIEDFAVHDWNATRLSVIRAIRDVSLRKTHEHDCAFFFAIDVDNFVIPSTLRELVALDLPIVAPFIREARDGSGYANYHAKIDAYGYYLETPRYHDILQRRITGLFEMPVVHCTYLVRADVLPQLGYEDGSGRFDYVIFSHHARKNNIPQYLDNRQVYGYLTLQEDVPELVTQQLATIAKMLDGGKDRSS